MNKKNKIITATSLAAASVAGIYIINKVITNLATVKNALEKSEGNYFDWRFGKVYYRKTGNGKPILLLHDIKTISSSQEWHKITKELAKSNTVYTIDLLGCGCSDKPNIVYTNYMFVQMITDFVKKVIGQKTDVIASGESVSIALMACKNDESIIGKIIGISPESLTKINKMPSKRTKTLKHVLDTPIFGTFIYNICVSKKRITTYLNSAFFDSSKIEKNDIIARSEASHLGNKNSKYLYSSIKGKYINTNILPALQTIDNSVYLISGKANSKNKMIIDQYLDFNPSIESYYIDSCGSLPQLEQPEELLEQIKLFLDILN